MENYSFFEKVLHNIVLSNNFVGEAVFDIENALYLNSAQQAPTQSVFVSGLARAGTTILMRSLYSTGLFSTLTYQDMPFVMAPNLWNKLSARSRKKIEIHERAHKDGIHVDLNSPEAFEEVFWRVLEGYKYVKRDCLVPHAVSPETLKKFASYQRLISLRYENGRYLSKNNNNILRLRSLSTSFKNAKILVPFRNPIDQANSLLSQHRRFSGGPRFQKDYMSWLGHFEFGDTHRPFRFSDKADSTYDNDSLNYWLKLWIDVYGYLLYEVKNVSPNILYVSYERLCSSEGYLKHVDSFIDVQRSKSEVEFINRRSRHESDKPLKTLEEEAIAIYESLNNI